MRLLILRTALAAVAVIVVWVVAGRRLTMLADRVGTVRVATPSVDSILYHPSDLIIGERTLSPDAPNGGSLSFALRADASDRVVLASGARTFLLGRRASIGESGVLARDRVVPDPGDHVVFTVDRSAISWPTPLEMNFMTGHSPSWKRNHYERLVWTKASGARLEMLWRYEQWYYGGSGWSGMMTNDRTTGLLTVAITP